MLAFFTGLGGKIAAGFAALGALWLYMWNNRREAVKDARQEDELAGFKAKAKVEGEHATDTHADRLERLRKATEGLNDR